VKDTARQGDIDPLDHVVEQDVVEIDQTEGPTCVLRIPTDLVQWQCLGDRHSLVERSVDPGRSCLPGVLYRHLESSPSRNLAMATTDPLVVIVTSPMASRNISNRQKQLATMEKPGV
jgi:hypothetical protein